MTMAQESLRELENKYEILVEDHGLVQGANNKLRQESGESKAAVKTLVRLLCLATETSARQFKVVQ